MSQEMRCALFYVCVCVCVSVCVCVCVSLCVLGFGTGDGKVELVGGGESLIIAGSGADVQLASFSSQRFGALE